MVYVVVDDIIPEAQSQGNGRAASWGAVVRYKLSLFGCELGFEKKTVISRNVTSRAKNIVLMTSYRWASL